MNNIPPWQERAALRSPPASIEAEQALLGAVLANNRSLDKVVEFLRPEHFVDPINGMIYAEILRLIAVGGSRVDGVVLKQSFENTGLLKEVGGTAYLSRLMGAMISQDITEYGRIIVDTSVRRALINLGEALVADAYGTDPVNTPSTIAQSAVTKIEAAVTERTGPGAVTLDVAMGSAIDAMEKARKGGGGISSGFECIDARLGGLEPGLVYVIAGRPGMGKSALGHQIAINVARSGTSVLELSLEMSATQLGRRTLAIAANVPIMAIKLGTPNFSDAERIVQARRELSSLPLYIDDTAGQTPSMLSAKARMYARKQGLGLILIDHLNLIRPDAQDIKHGATWSIERASGAVLQMAKDCGCPVILLAQLNRAVEGREDKRPGLSDLRQAGAIEQDAYAVGFVYRAEYYMTSDPARKENEKDLNYQERLASWTARREDMRGRAELIWAKVRDGEPGADPLLFSARTAAFSEGNQ